MITLYPSKEFRLPIIAESISPDVFLGKTRKEIEQLEVWEGNKQRMLGKLFKVKETGKKQDKIIMSIHGNMSRVRGIGAYMTQGEMSIRGDVGFHLGQGMEGGKIVVHGNTDGWAGSMMKGGTIEVHGNTGHYLGAPYRGSGQGMSGGKIIIYGNVGNEAGVYMKKGLIKIYGKAEQFTGFGMHNGTIYVQKDCRARVGACMKNGKIIVGGFLESVLPTFTIESIKKRVKIDEEERVEGPFYRFSGDLTENGKGKLYVFKGKNPQLSDCERLL